MPAAISTKFVLELSLIEICPECWSEEILSDKRSILFST
jgi:hypothetical protein